MFDIKADGLREVYVPLVDPGRVMVAGNVVNEVSRQFARIILPGKTNTLDGWLAQLSDTAFIPYFRVTDIMEFNTSLDRHSSNASITSDAPAVQCHYAISSEDGTFRDFETFEDITGELHWAASLSLDDVANMAVGDALLGTTLFYSVSVMSKKGMDLTGLLNTTLGDALHDSAPFATEPEYYILYPIVADELCLCPVSGHRVAVGKGEFDVVYGSTDFSTPPFVMPVEDARYIIEEKSISPAFLKILSGALTLLSKYEGDLKSQRSVMGKVSVLPIQSIIGRHHE